ncbi:MAG: hypothetical protein OEU92_12300 [Alphaproteobacteria bacterium]|nr:hypothetical protein [Alphaproteobacteria bacterium]
MEASRDRRHSLAELQLALGEVAAAQASGEASVEHADRSGGNFQRMVNRIRLADTKHQAGVLKAADTLFAEAETMQAESQPDFPWLYSLQGYQYCDLLLTLGQAEAVRERAPYAMDIALRGSRNLLDIALDHLSLGRAALALGDRDEARTQLDQAVDGLREAGDIMYLPHGLLARAVFFREVEQFDLSRRDLAEAMRIATRSGLRLHECDAHLEYARLALAEGEHGDAVAHFKSAASLVSECGYHRRDPEILELREKLGI